MKEKKVIKQIPDLCLYDWRNQEFLLIDWYTKLVESGDMYLTFAPDMTAMSSFLNFFKERAMLGYSADNHGIWFAVWFEPMLSGAAFGLWIRKDKRHTVNAFRLLTKTYDEAFKLFTVLVGISKQPDHRELHRKLGYTRLGTIPGLWNGEDVDIYHLTRQAWLNRKKNK